MSVLNLIFLKNVLCIHFNETHMLKKNAISICSISPENSLSTIATQDSGINTVKIPI